MKVYLDMDGVLADFDQAVLNRGIVNRHDFIHKPKSEWTAQERDVDVAVSRIMREPGFWEGIPVMKHAHNLVDILVELYQEVWILTARPNGDGLEWVAEEKKDWIRREFPSLFDDEFICCLRSEKAQYAKDNMLIDDMENNCREWRKAGGVAIHWK